MRGFSIWLSGAQWVWVAISTTSAWSPTRWRTASRSPSGMVSISRLTSTTGRPVVRRATARA